MGPSSPSTRPPFRRTCWRASCSAMSAAPLPARRPCAAAASSRPTAARWRLMAFDYPGNVRQLENVCHWLTVMAPSQVIEAKDLPPELLAERPLDTETPSVAQPIAVDVAAPPLPMAATALPPANSSSSTGHWLRDLERESREMLEAGAPEVWDSLPRR